MGQLARKPGAKWRQVSTEAVIRQRDADGLPRRKGGAVWSAQDLRLLNGGIEGERLGIDADAFPAIRELIKLPTSPSAIGFLRSRVFTMQRGKPKPDGVKNGDGATLQGKTTKPIALSFCVEIDKLHDS